MANDSAGEVDNEHSPPSSAEEAAALLGAAISFDAPMSSTTATGHANPPQGMHYIFTVQSPLPNQVLFVRMCNLRAWLRWHADGLKDLPDSDGLDDSVSPCLTLFAIADFATHDQMKTTQNPITWLHHWIFSST